MKVALALVLLAAACKDDKPVATTELERTRRQPRTESLGKIDESLHARKEASKQAAKIAAQADKEAEEAHAVVASLEAERAQVDNDLVAALAQVSAGGSKADVDKARAIVTGLQQQLVVNHQRLAEAKAKAARAERMRYPTVRKECQDNPLAKGCT